MRSRQLDIGKLFFVFLWNETNSRSEDRICLILPAHGFSHIIIFHVWPFKPIDLHWILSSADCSSVVPELVKQYYLILWEMGESVEVVFVVAVVVFPLLAEAELLTEG